jgi:hypothetical protein
LLHNTVKIAMVGDTPLASRGPGFVVVGVPGGGNAWAGGAAAAAARAPRNNPVKRFLVFIIDSKLCFAIFVSGNQRAKIMPKWIYNYISMVYIPIRNYLCKNYRQAWKPELIYMQKFSFIYSWLGNTAPCGRCKEPRQVRSCRGCVSQLPPMLHRTPTRPRFSITPVIRQKTVAAI